MTEGRPGLEGLRALSKRSQILIIAALVSVTAGGVGVSMLDLNSSKPSAQEISSQSKRGQRLYRPSDAEWATLVTEAVEQRAFRFELVTEGKITIDEDRSTPIFSPYAGRVVKLMVKPGDTVKRGDPLFVVEATDTVQALNDFITAITAMNKARSALNLAQILDKRAADLYAGKAVPLKDWQNAQAGLVTADNDMRSAQTALEAARNRLRILGRTDEEIATFEEKGRISPETPVYAPIAGTILQRKVGPGQFVSSSTSDPVFVVGDLSTVWLTAFVRETEAGRARLGEDIQFTVLAYPDQVFTGKINYISAALDATSRRLMVRATIRNPGELLKPEMFASVGIFTDEASQAIAAPRDALIYEGSSVRCWVARDDKSIELRQIRTGIINGGMIQVLDGLKVGERVITKGSLFIDRAAAGA